MSRDEVMGALSAVAATVEGAKLLADLVRGDDDAVKSVAKIPRVAELLPLEWETARALRELREK